MDHHGHHHHTTPPMQDTGYHHTGHHSDHTGHHREHAGHHGSHVAFFTTDSDTTLLLSSWNVNTKTGLFLACLVTIILGIMYQGIKCLRQYIHRDYTLSLHSIRSREHILQTLLYLIQIGGSYILMLIIMTYNVWVFIATIGGLGLGFFLCGWKMPKPSTECKNVKKQQNGGIQEQEQTLLSEEIEMSRETVL